MTKEQAMTTGNHREWLIHPEWWSDPRVVPVWRRISCISPAEDTVFAGDRVWQYARLGSKQTAAIFAADPLTVCIGVLGITAFIGSEPRITYKSIDELLAAGWVVD